LRNFFILVEFNCFNYKIITKISFNMLPGKFTTFFIKKKKNLLFLSNCDRSNLPSDMRKASPKCPERNIIAKYA